MDQSGVGRERGKIPLAVDLGPLVLRDPEVDLVPHHHPAAVPVEVPIAAPLGLEVPVLVAHLPVQVRRGGEEKPQKGSSQILQREERRVQSQSQQRFTSESLPGMLTRTTLWRYSPTMAA